MGSNDDYSPEDAVRGFPSNQRFDDNNNNNDNTNNNPNNKYSKSKSQISPDDLLNIMIKGDYNEGRRDPVGVIEKTLPPYYTRINNTDAFINDTLDHMMNPPEVWIFGEKDTLDHMMNPPEVWIFGEKEDAILLPLLLSAVGIIAVIGNLLVLCAFFRYARMRTGQNLMLVNVSIADLAFVFITLPVTILNHSVGLGYDPEARRTTPPPPQLCRFVHYVIFVGVYVAIYTLVVTCVFRFFAEFMKGQSSQRSEEQSINGGSDRSTIVGPRTGGMPPLTLGNAALSCAVIWIAFITSHLNFLIQKEGAIFEEPFICEHYDGLTDTAKMRTLWVTFLTCAFLLPLLIVCTLSALILRGVKDTCRKEFQMHSRSLPRSVRRQSSSAYSDRLRSGSYSGRRDSLTHQGHGQGYPDIAAQYNIDHILNNGTMNRTRQKLFVDQLSVHSKSPRDHRRQITDDTDQGTDCEIISTDVYDPSLTGRMSDHRRRLPSDTFELAQNCANNSRIRRELTIVVLICTIIRCICWLPIQIFLLIDVFTPGPAGPLGSPVRSDPGRTVDVYRKAEMVAVCFAFSSTLVNPFVYQCASFEFRRSFSQLFSRIFCCVPTTSRAKSNHIEAPADLLGKRTPVRLADMSETILSIISDSSNRINYA